ncbi:MAG TPA: prepilin peptidase [Desulfomicrobiaceae bacterium]|nr:prepilin peptidase [Desulfomicrobiaceae bacterium]
MTFPPYLFETAALILGLVLGSFYNVCIHRTLAGQSVVWPGSHCPKCGHNLSWWENIPVLSYIFLRGKCRSCQESISLRYPTVEILSGLLAAAFAYRFGPTLEWGVYMVVIGLLLVASFIDLDRFILPDVITLPGAVFVWLAAWLVLPIGWQDSLLGAGIGSGIFLALQQGYRLIKGVHGLGTGDIKLMLMLGGLVGWQGLPVMILLSSLSGLLVSLVWLWRDASKGMKTAIPFGPFLSLGTVATLLFGDVIWQWYLGI